MAQHLNFEKNSAPLAVKVLWFSRQAQFHLGTELGGGSVVFQQAMCLAPALGEVLNKRGVYTCYTRRGFQFSGQHRKRHQK